MRKEFFLTLTGVFLASVQAGAGVVADTLYMEARGEGESGLLAVATVIYNRAGGKADKMEVVCLKPKQFSCWNDSKTRAIAPKNDFDKKAYKLCLQIEKELLNGKFEPQGDWTHYYNPKLCNPKWAGGKAKTKIGNHTFLRTK